MAADGRADLFFVTLIESESDHSPPPCTPTRPSPTLFQWESQSTTSSASATGQCYTSGGSMHLFVRETRIADRDFGAKTSANGANAETSL